MEYFGVECRCTGIFLLWEGWTQPVQSKNGAIFL